MTIGIVRDEATIKIGLIRPPFGNPKNGFFLCYVFVGVSCGYNLLVITLKQSHFLGSKISIILFLAPYPEIILTLEDPVLK